MDDVPSILRELFVLSGLYIFPFFHFFIIEIIFTLIFSKSFLFDYFQESSDHQISLISVEKYEIGKKNFDLDMSCLFVWNYYKKYHPTKSNEKITVVLSSKLFEKICPQYHFQSHQESELQQWFRHNFRVERRSDKINDFQFCACDDSLFKNNKFIFFTRRKCWQKHIPTGLKQIVYEYRRNREICSEQ